jgi:DNA-binding transcriptional MerR regulator
MAAELASHREKHETLLQRLLAEQRARLEEEVHKLKRQLAIKGDEHGGALQALKEQVNVVDCLWVASSDCL